MRDTPGRPLVQKQPVRPILRSESDGFALARAKLGLEDSHVHAHCQRARRDPRGNTDAGRDLPRHGLRDDDLAKQVVEELQWPIWLRARRGLESLTTRVTTL